MRSNVRQIASTVAGSEGLSFLSCGYWINVLVVASCVSEDSLRSWGLRPRVSVLRSCSLFLWGLIWAEV